MTISTKQAKIIGTVWSAWSLLGAYRGGKCYDYEYNKQLDYYEKNRYSSKPTYFYTTRCGYMVCGMLVYANPIFMPYHMMKEMYRLEIVARKMENEKRTDYYGCVW